jgi:hypothetical protein
VIAEVLLGIATGLTANELFEVSPWCARKLARWSAFRRYADPGRAEMRAEEWAAVIDDRPGNLLKLITAVSFAVNVVIFSGYQAVARDLDSRRQSLAGWRLDLYRSLAAASARAAAVRGAFDDGDGECPWLVLHNLAVAREDAHNLARAICRARMVAFGNGLSDLSLSLNQAANRACALERELARVDDRITDLRIRDMDLTIRLGRARAREFHPSYAYVRGLALEGTSDCNLSYAYAQDLARQVSGELSSQLDEARISCLPSRVRGRASVMEIPA